jgi:hypothetical protein
MDAVNAIGLTWSGFTVWGNQWGFTGAAGLPFIRWNAVSYSYMRDVFLTSSGALASGNPSILNCYQCQNIIFEEVNAQGTSVNNGAGALLEVDNTSGLLTLNSFFSNNTAGPNIIFNASGARNASGQQVTMQSGGSDECSNAIGCVIVENTSAINLTAASVFGEPTGSGHGALNVDGTSLVYLTDMNVGPYSTGLNSNGITIASGGIVYATGSHIRGGGTTGWAVDGVAGATFIDDGGNIFQTCNGTTCTNVTPANFTTLAFKGGVEPKASLTHTPNTCMVTISPIVNSTTYIACNAYMDQNYQILHIKASSQATTSCTTAPIITISDGSQSATLTLTTAKSSWDSAVDTSTGIYNVFTSGNTMTVKYDVAAASVCATPPTNFAVTYTLQSVLNQ